MAKFWQCREGMALILIVPSALHMYLEKKYGTLVLCFHLCLRERIAFRGVDLLLAEAGAISENNGYSELKPVNCAYICDFIMTFTTKQSLTVTVG